MTAKPLVIIDGQLTWRVADIIRELGHEVIHVHKLGAIQGNDREIWKLAESKSAIVFTKDKDFLQFSNSSSSAKLLFYQGYNAKRSRLVAELQRILPEALKQLADGSHEVRIP